MALFIPTSKKRSEPCQTPRIWGWRIRGWRAGSERGVAHESKRPQFRAFGPVRSVRKLSWCRADLGKECGEGESELKGHRATVDSGQGTRFEALSRVKRRQCPDTSSKSKRPAYLLSAPCAVVRNCQPCSCFVAGTRHGIFANHREYATKQRGGKESHRCKTSQTKHQ